MPLLHASFTFEGADQVIKENDLPIETEHGNLDSLIGFNGDLVITMSDLTDELNADDRVPWEGNPAPRMCELNGLQDLSCSHQCGR